MIDFCCFNWQNVLAIAVVLLLTYQWYKRPYKFPPGPRGLPLVGSIPFMGKYPAVTMAKWSKSYGPITSVRFGPLEMVFLNDFNSVYEAYVKQASKFAGRPTNSYFHKFTKGYGISSLDYGDEWKIQRKFGLLTLKELGMGKTSVEGKIVEEVSIVADWIREKDGEPFDPSEILNFAMTNILCNVCFGKRFEYSDKKLNDFLNNWRKTVKNPVLMVALTVFILAPFLSKIPPLTYFHKKIQSAIDLQISFVRDFIKEHKEEFDKSSPRDFIDAYLVEIENGTDSSFSEEQLVQYVRDFFQAGTGTTYGTLTWALLCLLHFPEKKEKLREEIYDVIGRNGNVIWKKRLEMPYTSAFMEEVFRYRTLLPFGIQHSTTEDAHIGGCIIPKGTIISANTWAVHNDETIWDKPNQFSPERFLNDKGEFVRSQHVIPFSIGPRRCLGEQMGMMMFFFFLTSFVQRFDFLPDPTLNELPDIENGTAGFGFTAKPFKIVAKEC